MSRSILVIDTPESCRECMVRDLVDVCQAAGKSVEEYRGNKNKPDWCPLVEEKVKNMSEKEKAFINYILKKMHWCPFDDESDVDFDKCVGFGEDGCGDCIYENAEKLKGGLADEI